LFDIGYLWLTYSAHKFFNALNYIFISTGSDEQGDKET
jgi:hypothetical protein